MAGTAKKYPVIVVGSGVTGLSTAMHLTQLGIRDGLIVGEDGGVSEIAAGSLQGSQADNFTRFITAHGADFAAEFWGFGERAFDAVERFLKKNRVKFARGRRLRFVVSPEELVEVEEAVAALQAAGFAASLRKPQADDALTARVLAVQDDGDRSAYVDVKAFLRSLERNHTWSKKIARVEKIKSHPSGVSVFLNDGSEAHSETVVLANHVHIGAHVPSLREAFISIADQYLILACEVFPKSLSTPGFSLSCFHGYEWGVTLGPKKLAWGGGRFLRPLAGIGAEKATVDDKVTKYLLGSIEKTFAGVKLRDLSVKAAHAGLDCRPCDELPIIGPMFGDDRILMAGGYSGTGLPLGFYAGKCLADLLHTGRSEVLPHRLWPQRLRSLS